VHRKKHRVTGSSRIISQFMLEKERECEKRKSGLFGYESMMAMDQRDMYHILTKL
jgi:hypothetical protein